MMNHDLHTHTTYSDGSHSIGLQLALAEAMDLEAVAFTDHYTPGMKLGQDQGLFDVYLGELEDAKHRADGVLVLKGVEAQALDSSGTVSVPEECARRLDWVLCDLGGHSVGTLRNTPATKEAYLANVMQTYLRFCDIEYIDAIAHPFNTGNTTPYLLPEDYPESALRELAQKMAATRTVFDVMNLQIFWFQGAGASSREVTRQYTELVRLFAGEGVLFQVSSDDHRCGIGHTTWSRRVLKEAGVGQDHMVNPAELPLKRERDD